MLNHGGGFVRCGKYAVHMRIGSILSQNDANTRAYNTHTEFSTFSYFPEIYFQPMYDFEFSWISTCDVFTSRNVNSYAENNIGWERISAIMFATRRSSVFFLFSTSSSIASSLLREPPMWCVCKINIFWTNSSFFR